MAISRAKTKKTLISGSITSITLPTVATGLTAKLINLLVYSLTVSANVDIRLYEDSILHKFERLESTSLQYVELLDSNTASFYEPSKVGIKVSASSCYAVAYFIIE